MNSYTVCFANYTIGADAYENVADLCQIYGTRILLIGGSKALGREENMRRNQGIRLDNRRDG